MIFKNFAVIGHPVGHTMSPYIHSRLFALNGQKAHYGVRDIPSESLAASIADLKSLNGFNITIPHKSAIIPFLDDLDKKAAAFGSVNTVNEENGRLTGFTTDGEGFRRALETAGTGIGGKTVILGAGGAARAIAFEASLAGGDITIATREHSAQAAQKLCGDMEKMIPGARIGRCLIPELRGHRDLLVNATPAGMYPNTGACAASEEAVQGADCVFDAVYNPNETKLLRTARSLGKKAVGGMGMLVYQAAAAEEIWFGCRFAEKDLQCLCDEAALEMKKKFGSVILCGFMGSGKSTVGRLLAGLMGRRFVDLDQWIEQKEGIPIPEIFAGHGEAYFRELEKKAVQQLSAESGIVLSAGGGTLLNQENAAALRANGVVIFLDASLQAVQNRLAGDTGRPLLQRPDRKEALEKLYRERRGVYRAVSDIVLDADRSPKQVAQSAFSLLSSAEEP